MRALSLAPAVLLLSACFSSPPMTVARTNAWARDHADRAQGIVEAGTERMGRQSEWDAHESSTEP